MIEQSTYGKSKNDLMGFLIYLRRKIIYILILLCFVGIALSIYLFFIAQPTYEATAQMYVVGGNNSILNLANLEVGTYLISDYLKFFDLWEISQQVIEGLHLPYTPDEMQNHLTVTNPSYTRILMVTYSSKSAEESANIANMYAKVLQKYINDHVQIDVPVLISSAQVPESPSHPNKVMILEWGLLSTIFLLMWCLYISFLMGNKIETVEDLRECIGAGPIAVIPMCKQLKNEDQTDEKTRN